MRIRTTGKNLSPHAYLDPFVSTGKTVKPASHPPYVHLASTTFFPVSLASNERLIMVIHPTNTGAVGFYGKSVPGVVTTCYPILARQVGGLTGVTHITTERCGIQVQNISGPLAVSGMFHMLACNNMPSHLVSYDADNLGDPYIRLTDATVNSIANWVTANAHTRHISNDQNRQKSERAIITLTESSHLFSDFLLVDPTSNDSNVDYQNALIAEDLWGTYSTIVIYFDPPGIAQTLSFNMKSQHGVVFEVDSAFYPSAARSAVVDNVTHANLNHHAHTATVSGAVSITPATHEDSTMSKINKFIAEAGNVAGTAGDAIKKGYGAVRNWKIARQALKYGEEAGSVFLRAAPVVEEIAAPLAIL